MWWPSDLAYTIKKVIVWCDVHLTQLKSILFDAMSIDRAYTIKEYIVMLMTIWPILHN